MRHHPAWDDAALTFWGVRLIWDGYVEDRFSYENGTIEEGHEERASLKMRASLAPQGGQKKGDTQQNFSANMKVHVKMRQADMPAGLSNLLHLAANNMSVQETTMTEPVETTDDKKNSDNGQ